DQPAWTASGMLRASSGFGGQVDLSACFVERALELVAEGGVVAMVLPAKLTRTLYGGGFRRILAERTTLSLVWELTPDHFGDATTYPCAIVARRGAAPAGRPGATLRVRGADPARERHTSPRDLRFDADDLASPWTTRALLADGGDLELAGPRIGEVDGVEV